jgi:DNA protecting protein DprA
LSMPFFTLLAISTKNVNSFHKLEMTESISILPLLQLLHIPGVGHATLNRLLARMKGQGIALDDLPDFSPDDLIYQLGLKPDRADLFFQNRDKAQQIFDELERHSIDVLMNGDEKYPERLNRILGGGAPPVLFVQGNPQLLQKRSVAVVGARECSERGVAAAQACVEQLAALHSNIVSGNAPGIDRAAHCAALACGGTTTFTLAHGILQFQFRQEYRQGLQDGYYVVLSEFPPRMPWATHAAMQRNRTICALSHAVLLVESGTEGGTFTTGKSALKLGVPLFAVEYDPVPPSAKGNPYFLNRGARAIPENGHSLAELIEAVTHPSGAPSEIVQSLLFPNE